MDESQNCPGTLDQQLFQTIEAAQKRRFSIYGADDMRDVIKDRLENDAAIEAKRDDA